MPFIQCEEICPHSWDDAAIGVPSATQIVHRDECAYCCRTCALGDGVYVCMRCFTGLCVDHVPKHLSCNPTHTMFTLVQELAVGEEEEVRDVYRLGVVRSKTYAYTVCCGVCKLQFTSVPELCTESYHGIVHACVPGAQDAANEAPNSAFCQSLCPHLVCLVQSVNPYANRAPPSSEDTCEVDGCNCCLNNWMCVTCGAIGCPRAESGGKGHAIFHYESTGHPAVVKLGTITAEGADYYCYLCDDTVSDAHFSAHMAFFGINVRTSQKTAKTMGEMEYDYSTQWNFTQIMEAGTELTPLYGPGRTGIYNIGNTCYVASVVQCLMALKVFQNAFYSDSRCAHQISCRADPYNCRTCQAERIAAGLLSGEFSRPEDGQKGIGIRLFKKVYGQGHSEFSTMQQQDAQEYFLFLIQEMQRYVKPANMQTTRLHPSDIFEFLVEQRKECSQCHRVKYTLGKECCLLLPVPLASRVRPTIGSETKEESEPLRCSLEDCLQAMTKSDYIQCSCDSCKETAVYDSITKPRTFPDVLTICLRRTYFDSQTLTAHKLDVYVDVPEEINLEAYRAHGLQPGESEMAQEPCTALHPHEPEMDALGSEIDEVALATLVNMGIQMSVATYVLKKTNMNVERAVDYIFSHPEIEEEMTNIKSAHKASLATLPHSATTETSGIIATDGVPSYSLRAMISHIGSSAKTGHYVCHIKDSVTGEWILFNDEKVGVSQNPPTSLASVYFFVRKPEKD